MAWLQKRGNVWWIGYRMDGEQFRGSTGFTNRADAEKELAKHDAMAAARKAGALSEQFFRLATGKKLERPTLDAFLKQWLTEAEEHVAERTKLKYRQVVREFGESVRRNSPGLLLEDLTPDHVSAFLTQKRIKSSLSTVRGFRRILSSILIQARDRGHVSGNPVAVLRSIARKPGESKERRPFTLAEVRDLYGRGDAFWKFMIMAAFFTGQSMGDLITLKPANVDLAANVMRLARRKTGKRVIIPLAKPLRELLAAAWPKSEDGFFWPKQAERYLRTGATSFSQEFYDLLAKIGLVIAREDKQPKKKGRNAPRYLSGLGFHNLRHTFITNLKISGAVDSVAKELAGHSSTAINTQYTHLPIESLAKAINQLPEFSDELK